MFTKIEGLPLGVLPLQEGKLPRGCQAFVDEGCKNVYVQTKDGVFAYTYNSYMQLAMAPGGLAFFTLDEQTHQPGDQSAAV